MTTAIAPSTPWLYTVPYITRAEYARAPTAVDIKNLDRNGTAASQNAELDNVIARASSWVNVICDQNLAATVDVETGRVSITTEGSIFVHPSCWPLLELRQLLVGADPSGLNEIGLAGTFIERQGFTVPASSLGLTTSTAGPLQFAQISPFARAFAQWTYVNGWPTTTLAQATVQPSVPAWQTTHGYTVGDEVHPTTPNGHTFRALDSGTSGGSEPTWPTDGTAVVDGDIAWLDIGTGGANLVVVTNPTGIYGPDVPNGRPFGTQLVIYDGASTETVNVASITGSTLTLTDPLLYAHQAGVSISSLPPAVKEATILLTSAFVKSRGREAIVMDAIRQSKPTKTTDDFGGATGDAMLAKSLLAPFARVR